MTSTLKALYTDYRDQRDGYEAARALLGQMDWFNHVARFDPKTGEALPQSLSPVLKSIAEYPSPGSGRAIRDRLWWIADHSRPSLERLIRSLNESPHREHALLAVHAVRELDANSFIKLSNRPGRTVREKLAGKPYLQAVRRFQSVDLPENRLLKAFAIRLAELLELRLAYLGEDHELLHVIHSWMHSDDAHAIGRWDNLPPNNVLLSHREYRRIWDAWRRLQSLDDDLEHDRSQFDARGQTIRRWTEYAQMWADGIHLFAETPVRFDFDRFGVRPWSSEPVTQKTKQRILRHGKDAAIAGPACVDFTGLRPCYATASASGTLRETYLWQHWTDGDESIDLELFDIDAACLHSDATTISSPDLFFSRRFPTDLIDRAARAFTARVREVVCEDPLVWLVPDALSDFELEVMRRHLNARFRGARPLPRSVAAVFEQVDASTITKEGFTVAVIDHVGGMRCVTRLVACVDQRLKKRVPESQGVYWERCPPVILSGENQTRDDRPGYDLITVGVDEQWRDAHRPASAPSTDDDALRRDTRIERFDHSIDLTASPVAGGMRLHSLQQRASDIPLWRDQIPELSIKLMKDGLYQRFHLVSRGATIKPLRGVSVPISVDETFTLLAGKPFYQFPLFQGEDARELGFSAQLDSPAFPLQDDAVCTLHLTFEYGADEPYQLTFNACDGRFDPVRAQWREVEELAITEALAPDYPAPMTWDDLRRMPSRDGRGALDLVDWMRTGIAQIEKGLSRKTGRITKQWSVDPKGQKSTYVLCDELPDAISIHEASLLHGVLTENLQPGDRVSFEWLKRGGKYQAGRVAKDGSRELNEHLARSLRSLRFSIIRIWDQGRWIGDANCPSSFADQMRPTVEYLRGLSQRDAVPPAARQTVLSLLACMHKEASPDCIKWIRQQVRDGKVSHPRTVGYALGDVSEPWQKEIFAKLLPANSKDSLRVFGCAIWREKHFVERFDIKQLNVILRKLTTALSEESNAVARRDPNVKDIARHKLTVIADLLELLLGLLRTRNSSDAKIKMLLQPHQKVTKELARHVERIGETLVQSNATLRSHLQISIPRPEGKSRTPDLLLALSRYLAGDDAANAIHITSSAEGDSG
ncbi:DNA-binding protein [Caballeronia sp. S22]|uniref:DNA-binding protein n=1 Tax=Caballeronia sp. S22 TaxID=3137182 RepID=UPI00353148A7